MLQSGTPSHAAPFVPSGSSAADFASIVCKWQPSRLAGIAQELAANHPKPATRFSGYDAFSSYFQPLLLAELAADLASVTTKAARAGSTTSAHGPSQPVRVIASRIQKDTDGYVVDVDPTRGEGHGRGRPAPLGCHDGDLVAIWKATTSGTSPIDSTAPPASSGRPGRNAQAETVVPDSAVFALVKHGMSKRGGARITMVYLPGKRPSSATDEQGLEDGECAEDEGESKPQEWMFLQYGSVVTLRREFNAVQNIKNSSLLPAILAPVAPAQGTKGADPAEEIFRNAVADPTKHATLGYAQALAARRRLNPSQARAVIVGAVSSSGFSVIQGPPGTGKTRTILVLLNVLHVDQYQRYYNGLVAALKERINAASIRKTPADPRTKTKASSSSLLNSMATVMDQTLSAVRETDRIDAARAQNLVGLNGTNVPRRPRLLVCAPSNAAVDEILTRLITTKFLDGNGQEYSPEIARIGAGDKVAEAARPLTAEGQAEAFLLKLHPRDASPSECAENQREYLANWQRLCNSLLSQLQHAPKDDSGRPRVISLHEQIERLNRDLRRLKIVCATGPDPTTRELCLRKLARTYVEDAQVVFATLSGSASSILTSSGERGEPLFDTVILDEGSQATEPSSLIPLCYGAKRCIIVGDPQQLPATVLASGSAGVAYGQSLLDRLCRSGSHAMLLDTQYRMHPAISSFPRRHFYGGRLLDDESVQDDHRAAPYHMDPIKPRLGPYVFLDVAVGQERRGGDDPSMYNPHEAELAVSIYKKLKKTYPTEPMFTRAGKSVGSSVGFGVVTPYKRQLQELRQCFDRAGVPTGDVEIDTVDAYQGREKEVIVFSCVRTADAQRGIGFVRDVRRMNVGLTRARSSLIILGSATALSNGSQDWKELVDDASSRGCLIQITSVARALTLEPEAPTQSEVEKPASAPVKDAPDKKTEPNVASAEGPPSAGAGAGVPLPSSTESPPEKETKPVVPFEPPKPAVSTPASAPAVRDAKRERGMRRNAGRGRERKPVAEYDPENASAGDPNGFARGARLHPVGDGSISQSVGVPSLQGAGSAGLSTAGLSSAGSNGLSGLANHGMNGAPMTGMAGLQMGALPNMPSPGLSGVSPPGVSGMQAAGMPATGISNTAPGGVQNMLAPSLAALQGMLVHGQGGFPMLNNGAQFGPGVATSAHGPTGNPLGVNSSGGLLGATANGMFGAPSGPLAHAQIGSLGNVVPHAGMHGGLQAGALPNMQAGMQISGQPAAMSSIGGTAQGMDMQTNAPMMPNPGLDPVLANIRSLLAQVSGVVGSHVAQSSSLEQMLYAHVASGGSLDLESVVAAAIACGSGGTNQAYGGATQYDPLWSGLSDAKQNQDQQADATPRATTEFGPATEDDDDGRGDDFDFLKSGTAHNKRRHKGARGTDPGGGRNQKKFRAASGKGLPRPPRKPKPGTNTAGPVSRSNAGSGPEAGQNKGPQDSGWEMLFGKGPG